MYMYMYMLHVVVVDMFVVVVVACRYCKVVPAPVRVPRAVVAGACYAVSNFQYCVDPCGGSFMVVALFTLLQLQSPQSVVKHQVFSNELPPEGRLSKLHACGRNAHDREKNPRLGAGSHSAHAGTIFCGPIHGAQNSSRGRKAAFQHSDRDGRYKYLAGEFRVRRC